jgi:hypothetical protein
MSYRIDYSRTSESSGNNKLSFRLPALTLLFLMFFFYVVYRFWPEGMMVLACAAEWIKVHPVVDAIEASAVDFQEGKSVLESLLDFLWTMQS